MKMLVLILFMLSFSSLAFADLDYNKFTKTNGEKYCHVDFSEKFIFDDYSLSDIKKKGFYKWDGNCKNGKANGDGKLTIYVGTVDDSREIRCEMKGGIFVEYIHAVEEYIFCAFIILLILGPIFSKSDPIENSNSDSYDSVPTGDGSVDYAKYDNDGFLKPYYKGKRQRPDKYYNIKNGDAEYKKDNYNRW